MSAMTKYEEAIVNAPARGGGLHQHMLRIARLGIMADLSPQAIISECADRVVGLKPNEAAQAVGKASNTSCISNEPVRSHSIYMPSTKGALDKFIEGQPQDFMEILEMSPVRLAGQEDDARLLIHTLYDPDDYLFIGDVYTSEVQSAKAWVSKDLTPCPHIIPNPMTGEAGLTTEGKESRRCEATVKDMRYAVCEMDEVPLEKQVGFWMKCIEIKLPIAAIIHSGSKSLHGWVYVDCKQDAEKWKRDVKGWLFGEFGKMYGLDKACSNKARLSRLAGHERDKGTQHLLYLDGGMRP
jgi:hypothetical protein